MKQTFIICVGNIKASVKLDTDIHFLDPYMESVTQLYEVLYSKNFRPEMMDDIDLLEVRNSNGENTIYSEEMNPVIDVMAEVYDVRHEKDKSKYKYVISSAAFANAGMTKMAIAAFEKEREYLLKQNKKRLL
jgi:hypothetical protein